MRKDIICLALMLCLMLTACGSREETPPQGQVSLSESKAEEPMTMEEQVLLTVDGREIPAWRYFYWLRRACETIGEQYASAGKEVDWSERTEKGTLAEYVKAQALSDTALYATVENWAQKYGCNVQGSANVTGENGLTTQQAGELETVGQLYGELYTLFCTEGSLLAATEEELDVFAEEAGWMGCQWLLMPFGEDREAARQKAAEVFARLNTAEDIEAEFSALAAEGVDLSDIQTLQWEDGTLQPEHFEVLSQLEEGQFSGIVETAEGYTILRRLKPEKALVREALFDHLLLEAAAQADIRCVSAYKTLDVAEFWKKLQAEKTV